MRLRFVGLFLALLCVVGISANNNDVLSAERCLELGFSRETLVCSSCDRLREYVKDEELFHDCLTCCEPEFSDDSSRFQSATLTLCDCILPSSPHIDAFLRREARHFPNLKIRYVNGHLPILELRHADGRVAQSIGISGWKTEQIKEFLTQKLVQPQPDGAK